GGHGRRLTICIRMNLDCADACETTGRVLWRQTGSDAAAVCAFLEAWRAACKACADEMRAAGGDTRALPGVRRGMSALERACADLSPRSADRRSLLKSGRVERRQAGCSAVLPPRPLCGAARVSWRSVSQRE